MSGHEHDHAHHHPHEHGQRGLWTRLRHAVGPHSHDHDRAVDPVLESSAEGLRAWLIHHTRVTKVAAVAHTAWATRSVTHPQVVAALAAGDLSESYGRAICEIGR